MANSTLEQFFERLLPDTANYTLWLRQSKRNLWFPSLEEMAAAADELAQAGTTGLYFSNASFNDEAVANGQKDARTRANVVAKKAFYLDLDAGAEKLAKHGPDKVYATQRDALADSVRFFKATNLLPSYVVSSGEGLHLYWALDEAVDPQPWHRVARSFSRLARQMGLKEDTACTTDSVRLLRVPGGLHENGNIVTILKRGPIYGFEQFDRAVSDLLGNADELPEPVMRGASSRANPEAEPPKYRAYSMLEVIKHCAALRKAIEDRGAETPYQPWLLALQMARLSVEGEELGHAISQGHRDYDQGVVDRKMRSLTGGPPLCETWHLAWGEQSPCLGCLYGGIAR